MYPVTAGPNATLNFFNNLDETSETGPCLMFAHYTTNKIRVACEAKANRAEFHYTYKNNLTKPDGNYMTLINALTKTRDSLAQYMAENLAPTRVSSRCRAAMPTPEKVPSKSKQLGANQPLKRP